MKTRSLKPYLFLLPMIIIVTAIIIYPVIYVFYGSLTTTASDGSTVFAGFDNFRMVFKDPLFKVAIINNFKLFLIVPILTILSLIIASMLADKIRGWKFYRSIIFIPYILAITVVGIVFSYIFQYNGILNTFLRNIGLDALALDWLGTQDHAMNTVAFVIMWKQLGYGVILFLARIQSIDNSLYESAALDGVTDTQKLIYITIPQAKEIIEFYIVITLIEMLSWVFNYVYVMTSGGPGSSTYILEYLIYKKAFGGGNYNIAQAVSVIVLLIASVIIVARQILMKKGDSDD